jgi:hypothetical protein
MLGEPDPKLSDEAEEGINEALEVVEGLAERYEALFKSGGDARSMAESDRALSAVLGDGPLHLATDQLSSAVDHLVTWRALFRAEQVPAFAHLTLIRAATEATVTARWLLDPKAESMDRVARAVGFMSEDYEERRKAENSFGMTAFAPDGKSAAARKADLESDRLADHIKAVQPLSLVDLFKRYFLPDGEDGAFFYRILSANAHARRWRLGMNTIADIGGSDPPLSRISAGDDIAWASTANAVLTLTRAMDEAEGYLRSVSPGAHQGLSRSRS